MSISTTQPISPGDDDPVDPVQDIVIIPACGAMPSMSPLQKAETPEVTIRQELTSKVLIDATKPPHRPVRREMYDRLKPIGLDTLRK